MQTQGWSKTIYLDKEPDILPTTMIKELSAADINEIVASLAQSYNTDESAVTYEFQKISDVLDEDAATCIRIIFYIRDPLSVPSVRKEIFNLKMLLPDEILVMAKQILQERQVVATI
jgi:hypothetical protein